MPQANYFEVHVRNTETKKDFDEHQIKTTDKQTECYIESRTGEQFEIYVKINRTTQPAEFRNSTYSFYVYVDGQSAGGVLLGTVNTVIYEDGTVRGMRLSQTELAPFVFGQTVFTENGHIDSQLLSKLGCIEIEFFRVQCIRRDPAIKGTYCDTGPKEPAVNEKAKKALLTHSVKYGDPVKRKLKDNYRWKTKVLDPNEEPMHTVTLFYRSRDILEAMDIIPTSRIQHSTSQSPSPDSDSDSDSDSSPEATAEKLRRLKNELRELKRKVKLEPEPEPVMFDLTGSGPELKKRKIVVDLTI